jgi:Txe/YoeB family toxin of Txe-Axe toxin-antitoxin module
MKIAFTESGWNDYVWFQANDRKLVKRINLLVRETLFDHLLKELESQNRLKVTCQVIGHGE